MIESLMPEYVSVVCVFVFVFLLVCFVFLSLSLHPHYREGERRKHVQSEFGDPSVEGLLLCQSPFMSPLWLDLVPLSGPLS